MKWAITGLTVLGIAAAACAALLVSALRAGSFSMQRQGKDLEGDVQVIYAKVALDSMTVVDGSMVASKTVKRSEAPPKSISDPVQVVGRVLTVAMLPGQAFNAECFAADRSASLAAAVGKGKRAVGISVTDYAGLEGLLYPGSVVDVFLTLKPESPSAAVIHGKATQRGALTTTLLERVQVLAVEAKSVVSGSADTVGTDVAMAADTISRANRSRRVTLLVDTKQAKALQLGMEQGTLSLALRNPLDTGNADREQVSLRSILGLKDEPVDAGPSAWERMLAMAVNASSQMAKNASKPKTVGDPFAAPAGPKKWETTVIRGDKSQTYSFPMEEGGGNEAKSAASAPAPAEKMTEPTPAVVPPGRAEGDPSPKTGGDGAAADAAAASAGSDSTDTVTIVPPPVAPAATR
jgi:pilus assembly protein CpaB